MDRGTVRTMPSVTPLKRVLLDEGRKQSWLAQRVGIDEATLSRIVNGLHCPIELREAIASALRRPVADLWPVDDERAAG